jgi:hypothetical protein
MDYCDARERKRVTRDETNRGTRTRRRIPARLGRWKLASTSSSSSTTRTALNFEEPARLLLLRYLSRNSFLFSIVDSPAATVDNRASEPDVPIALPPTRAPPSRSPQHPAQLSQTMRQANIFAQIKISNATAHKPVSQVFLKKLIRANITRVGLTADRTPHCAAPTCRDGEPVHAVCVEAQ